MSRILQDADLQPHRQQMYLTSHDDEFRDDLAAKIDAYVAWHLQTDRPFCWSYRPKSWS